MSNEIESTIQIIEEANKYISKASIIEELEIIIERLKISGLEKLISSEANRENAQKKIEEIFKEIISSQMLGVLVSLLTTKKLDMFLADQSRKTLEEIRQYYAELEEIYVTTSVDLTKEFMDWLSSIITPSADARVRTVFNVDETIIAGVKIIGRGVRYDLSYRKCFLPLVREHLTQKLTEMSI